uniref:Uncharacterized protein n=1 Tax=Anguilla anguilla TaxID=7936 RepID=A0A0E9TB20_ANGAN
MGPTERRRNSFSHNAPNPTERADFLSLSAMPAARSALGHG